MAHIAHLRNPFKSINTFEKSYDYIIKLIGRGTKPNISSERIKLSLFVQTWIINTPECFVQKLVVIGRIDLEKKILEFRQCFFVISFWKKAWPFIWTNRNFLYPRMLPAKFYWNLPSGSGEEDFQITSIYFLYFANISPWKRTLPSIWTNVIALHARLILAIFGSNWQRRCAEDENMKSLQMDGQTPDDRWSEKLTWAFSSAFIKWANKGSVFHFKLSLFYHIFSISFISFYARVFNFNYILLLQKIVLCIHLL